MATDDKAHGWDCAAGTEAADFPPGGREAEDCEADAGAWCQRGRYRTGERRERQPGVSLEATVRTWRVAGTQVEAGRCSGAGDDRGRTGSAEAAGEFDTGTHAAFCRQHYDRVSGRALLSIEGAADPAVIRAVLESLTR